MNVKYFTGADTAQLEFPRRLLTKRERLRSVYVVLDKDGTLVSMTIEHAATLAGLPTVSFRAINAGATALAKQALVFEFKSVVHRPASAAY